MKKGKKLLGILVLVVMVVVTIIIPVSAEQTEYIINGTFDERSTGWGLTQSTQGVMTRLPEGGYNETGGLEIKQTTPDTVTMVSNTRTRDIEVGKAYKLTFWFKTDADVGRAPFVRMSLRFGDPAKHFQIEFASNQRIYRLDSGTRVRDFTYEVQECEKDTWTFYTYCFNIPEIPEGQGAYGGTMISLGGSGYVGDEDNKSVATFVIDDVSMVEDTSSVKYFDTEGKELYEMPSPGQKVVAKYHIASAGKASDIAATCIFTGLFEQSEGIKKLEETVFINEVNGTAVPQKVSDIDFDIVRAPDDIEIEFTVPNENYSLATFLWDSLTSMKPIESKVELN